MRDLAALRADIVKRTGSCGTTYTDAASLIEIIDRCIAAERAVNAIEAAWNTLGARGLDDAIDRAISVYRAAKEQK